MRRSASRQLYASAPTSFRHSVTRRSHHLVTIAEATLPTAGRVGRRQGRAARARPATADGTCTPTPTRSRGTHRRLRVPDLRRGRPPRCAEARAAGSSRWGSCERARGGGRCVYGLPRGGAEEPGWCRADGVGRRRAWPRQGRGPPESSMDRGTCRRRMAMTQLRACSCRWSMGLWGCRSPRRRGGAGLGRNTLGGGVPSGGSAWNLDRRARRRLGRAGRGSAGSKGCLRGGSPRRGGLSGYLYRWAPRSPLEPPCPGWGTEYPLPPLTALVFTSFRCVRYGVVWKERQALVRGGARGPAALPEGVEGARSGR